MGQPKHDLKAPDGRTMLTMAIMEKYVMNARAMEEKTMMLKVAISFSEGGDPIASMRACAVCAGRRASEW